MGQINLVWASSTDNVGVAGYKVRRGGVVVATVSGTSYDDAGLADGTSYSYTVQAFDAAGNLSAESGSVAATTLTSGSGGGIGTPPPSTFFITPDDAVAGMPLLRDLETSSVARNGAPLSIFSGSTLSDLQAFLDAMDDSMRYVGLPWGLDIVGGLGQLTFRHANKYVFPTGIPSTYAPGGEPKIGQARIVTANTADNVILDWLNLDCTHSPSGNTSGDTVGGAYCELRRCEVYQSIPGDGTIGVSPLGGSTYGPGDYFKLRVCRVHDIGEWPVSSASAPGFFMHGAYMQTAGILMEDVWLWNCSRSGLLLRGATHGIFRYVAADRCGLALAFGDDGSAYNEVHHFIGTNSFQAGHVDDYGAYAYLPGPGNSLHDSNFWNNIKGDYAPSLGAIKGANCLSVDPVYVHGCPAGGVSGGGYASGDPTLIDLRPTDSTLVADGMGARMMIPSFL